jgi:hypothetical protein
MPDSPSKYLGKYVCVKDDFMSENALHKINKEDVVEIFFEKDSKLDGDLNVVDLYSIFKDGYWIMSTIQIDKINEHFKSFKEIRDNKIDNLI